MQAIVPSATDSTAYRSANGYRQIPTDSRRSTTGIQGVSVPVIVWKDQPDAHDYPAAAAYLSLVATGDLVGRTSRAEGRPARPFQGQGHLAGVPMTSATRREPACRGRYCKVDSGKQLSPVLLVRGALTRGFPLQIADGYHRVCASYHLGENNDIPCRIAELPAG